MLSPGSTFAEYTVEATVAQSATGTVYRATHRRLGRRVALKVVPYELAGDADVRERLVRESVLVASIDHTNVLPVYEAGEHARNLFLAMRWVEGESLEALLEREGALVPARAVDIALQVGRALDAAHERGLVHRDVRPGNVLVERADHVYLGDFGLGRRTESLDLTATQGLLGSVDYAAPEQIRGDRVDRRADVYSLGCLLFAMLTGRPPFAGQSAATTMWAHVNEAPPSLAERRRGLPAALEEVMGQALAKQPEQRQQSAGAFAEEARVALARPRRGARVAGAVAPSRRPTALRERPRPSWMAPPEPVAPPLEPPEAAPVPRRVRPAQQPVRERPRSSPYARLPRRAIALVVGAVALAALAAGLIVGSDDENRAAGAPTPTSVALRAPATAIVAGGGRLWVTQASGIVRPLDPARGAPVGRARDVSGTPVGIAIGSRAAWVLDAGAGVVRAVHRRTLAPVRSVPVGAGAAGVVAADGVWVASTPRDAVIRLSPAGRRLIPVGSAPVAVAVGEGAAWVANSGDDSVTRIPVRGRARGRSRRVGREPAAVAVAAGAVWVANHGDDTVSRLDPRSGRVTATVRVGAGPLAIAGDENAVWVVNGAADSASRIDPKTLRAAAPVALDGDPVDLAITPRAVWVARADAPALVRIPR